MPPIDGSLLVSWFEDDIMRDPRPKIAALIPALAGNPRHLAESLGTTEGLVALVQATAELQPWASESLVGLNQHLARYRQDLLVPIEWPSILEAYRHVCRHEARELIRRDQQLGRDSAGQSWLTPSARIGQRHLQALRPLRDHRVVQRYLQAVDQGLAQGWHSLVYGVMLAVYSLPLRQGLLNFAWLTLCSRLRTAQVPDPLSTDTLVQLAEEQLMVLLPELDRLLG